MHHSLISVASTDLLYLIYIQNLRHIFIAVFLISGPPTITRVYWGHRNKSCYTGRPCRLLELGTSWNTNLLSLLPKAFPPSLYVLVSASEWPPLSSVPSPSVFYRCAGVAEPQHENSESRYKQSLFVSFCYILQYIEKTAQQPYYSLSSWNQQKIHVYSFLIFLL